MSVLLKLICIDCREGVHIGSSNTRIVENPEEVGEFIWSHQNHNMTTISDSHDCFSNWVLLKRKDETA